MAGWYFRVLDALLSTVTSGEVRLKIGNKATNEGYGDGVAMWGTDGFIARPNAPDSRGACQVLALQDGNNYRCIGARDNRIADKVGTLAEGDRAIVTDAECRVLVKKATEAVTLYTAAQNGGASLMVTVSGEDDGTIQLIHGGGAYVTVDKDKIVASVGGKASITLNGDGSIQIIGTYIGLNAPGGNLGLVGPSGESPPAAPLASILAGPSGMAGVPAAHWTVSPV